MQRNGVQDEVAEPKAGAGAMTVSGGKEFYGVFGGPGAGVYTSRAKAESAARRADGMRVFVQIGDPQNGDRASALEKAMKYAQLGFDEDTGEFTVKTVREHSMFFRRPPDPRKPLCMAYMNARGSELGFYLSTERQTFVQPGFDPERETMSYLKGLLQLIDIVFGMEPDDGGGLLDPGVHGLVVAVPVHGPIRRLAQPKNPMEPGEAKLIELFHRLPVGLTVDRLMCHIQVGFEEEKVEK